MICALLLQDAVLGIDTEWKPDFKKGTQSKTAMISLASSSCVVLVRTCSMGWKVPKKLLEFCKYIYIPSFMLLSTQGVVARYFTCLSLLLFPKFGYKVFNYDEVGSERKVP